MQLGCTHVFGVSGGRAQVKGLEAYEVTATRIRRSTKFRKLS